VINQVISPFREVFVAIVVLSLSLSATAKMSKEKKEKEAKPPKESKNQTMTASTVKRASVTASTVALWEAARVSYQIFFNVHKSRGRDVF
jgi:hypothetical protein